MPWYDVPYISTIDYTLSEFIPMMLKVMLGYASAGGDHFGIFPCCGVILLGSYIGKKFYAERKSLLPKLDGKWNIGLRWIGKRTAWIYLSHQPIIMLIVMLIGLVSGLEVF